jgi:tetratricopeptide (TPR) repeat protein
VKRLSCLLLSLLAALPVPGAPSDTASHAPEEAPLGVTIDPIQFGKVTWGRNSLRLKYHNASPLASSLALRVRTHYPDSVSGVYWELTYPLLLPPELSGEFMVDYFVRPDHGRLQIEIEGMGGDGVVFRQERELSFEAPYRDEYVLQPSHLGSEGLEWEGRAFPAFKVREEGPFIVYYFPGSEVEQDLGRILPQRQKILEKLEKEFQIQISGKVILFFYPDAETLRKLTGNRADGFSYGRTIVEVYGSRRKIDASHELVHLVAGYMGRPPVLFAEGLATSRQKDFDNAGKYPAGVEEWCHAFLRENALISLEELMEYSSFGENLTRPRIAYPESACFVNFLIRAYGWDKFRQAYSSLTNDPDPGGKEKNLSLFRQVFGKELREVEADWKEALSETHAGGLPEEVARNVVVEETVPYLVERGRRLLTSGLAPDAEKLLARASALDPADLEAAFWLAQAYHVDKKTTAALEAYEKVIRLGDRTHLMEIAWSHVWAAQILDQSGRREEALAHYRAAESLHERSEVRIEGRITTSLEAARQGLARPFAPEAESPTE